MRVDVYGLFELDVVRRERGWVVYRVRDGRREAMPELTPPKSLKADELPQWLDDLLHEHARPGTTIRIVRGSVQER